VEEEVFKVDSTDDDEPDCETDPSLWLDEVYLNMMEDVVAVRLATSKDVFMGSK
jgi:hypothetical protein